MNMNQWSFRLYSLSAYGDLNNLPLFQTLKTFFASAYNIVREDSDEEEKNLEIPFFLSMYSDIFRILRESGHKGLGDYLWDYCRYEPTLYGKMLAENLSDPALENVARREIDFLVSLSKLDCDELLREVALCISPDYHSILADLPRWSNFCPLDFDKLTAFHKEQGYGIFARYAYFVWRENTLSPVKSVDNRAYSSLHGYGLQREQVLENTGRLIKGEPAQNILLFGEGGTGKSAVVKSMVSAYPSLRLIQAEHDSLRSLPKLMAQLGQRQEKFILFIDDLAFDQDDNTFSALKSILEGGLETPPQNVLVYATSNRRHLVRQTFSERAGEEVDMMETISEKTALAERFGLRIPYMSMKKEEYLSLVDYLYAERDSTPSLSKEDLHHKAMMWELRHGGRTPRVAGQFVDNL